MLRAITLLALLGSVARADSRVDVMLNAEGMQLAQQLGVSPQDLAMQIKTRVDEVYQTSNVDGFLRSFADATSFSARGIGVDYGSTPRGFLAGFAVNVAAAGNPDIRDGDVPTAGLAANLSVMLGLNLAEWQHERWTLFANGFYRNGATERLDGGILTFGAHAQVKLAMPTESGGAGTAVRWTGLALTGGLEFTRWNLGSGGETMSTDFDVGGGGGSANVTLDSIGRFDLTSTALTVPLELSTGLRIALLVTAYGGVGVDFTAGKSEVDASLTGQMRTSDNRDIGDVAIASTGSNSGSPASGRLFAGVQVNLWKLKVFAQANASAQPAASVGFGIRFVQ
jgi:hypothetical protein